MASLNSLKERFLKLQGREITLAAEAITDSHNLAEDLNADQLAKGIKVDGTAANFTYSPMTIAIKKQRSGLASVTDHLTNYDTGESYRQLFEKVENKKVIFGTGTDKEDSISDRMDDRAFGLTKDNKEIFMKDGVLPKFFSLIHSELKI